jgi:hypothetical protein
VDAVSLKALQVRQCLAGHGSASFEKLLTAL